MKRDQEQPLEPMKWDQGSMWTGFGVFLYGCDYNLVREEVGVLEYGG